MMPQNKIVALGIVTMLAVVLFLAIYRIEKGRWVLHG